MTKTNRQSDHFRPWAVLRKVGRSRVIFLCAVLAIVSGCQHFTRKNADVPYLQAATAIKYPELDQVIDPVAHFTPRPVSLSSEVPTSFREISLEEAVKLALAKSTVFRDLGGVVLTTPGAVRTPMDPAIQETDPRFGPQAALSAFDATFAANLFFEKNDRALNNEFFGGGTRILRQEAMVYQAEIAKRTPFGSEFTLRNFIDYDDNNAPGNAFESAWNFNVEAEYRQSLLRGAGIDFGRIAGTSNIPGVYNGVLVARTNTDVSIADFELSVRDLVDEVEDAYWNLYFAYRNLASRIAARDAALATWRRVEALRDRGRIGGEADKEAEAREQYYRFQEEVENALSGQLFDGTTRSETGVYLAERRLRYLVGLPATGDEVLRPSDEPTRAEIFFDWEICLEECLANRAELRRQKWMIKRREMELLASRNFLLPELDVVALSRWRGFGENFARYHDSAPFASALGNFADGNFQETQVGVELAFPFGNRQAHAGVRNAEFLLARERALLFEQEQRVVHDLSNALAEVERSYRVLQTVFNRRQAAKERTEALQAAFDADKVPLNILLDAQRRLANAETDYDRTLISYSDAIRRMHLTKGTLLEYSGVHLSEGPWPEKAYEQGIDRLSRQKIIDNKLVPTHRVISTGTAEL